jgi:hypothetical protein
MTSCVPTITTATLCERRRLIDMRGAAFLRGKSVRTMQHLVEGGARRGREGEAFEPGLEWVWNVGVNPASEKRALRFWAREVIAPETCRKLTLPDVINLVLPDGQRRFAPGQVADLLLCDYQHLYNLKAAGQLPGRRYTRRASLIKFLTKRFVKVEMFQPPPIKEEKKEKPWWKMLPPVPRKRGRKKRLP